MVLSGCRMFSVVPVVLVGSRRFSVVLVDSQWFICGSSSRFF